jgi:hypothetical protein
MVVSSNESTAYRLVWLATGVIFAIFVSVGASVLAWLNGEKIPAAILTGGGAFAATITIVILLMSLILG